MKSTNNNSKDSLPQIEPTKNKFSFCCLNQWLILAVAVVVTAVVFGGGVFWLMNNRLITTQMALEQRIVDLQNQAAQPRPVSAVESEPGAASISTADWKVYKMNDFQFKYPSDWTIADVVKNGSEFSAKLKDASSKYIGSLKCPFTETGYEAWSFEDESRQYINNGQTYGADLWSGTPLPGQTSGTNAAIIFMYKGSDRLKGDYKFSCEIVSLDAGSSLGIFRKIYETLE